jgi:hypothetical protein
MDFPTFLTTVTSSLGISMAGAYWLAKTLIQHRLTQELEIRKSALTRELEDHKSILTEALEQKKAELQGELARDKALVEGEVKREIELQLGDRAVQRQYEFEARNRTSAFSTIACLSRFCKAYRRVRHSRHNVSHEYGRLLREEHSVSATSAYGHR